MKRIVVLGLIALLNGTSVNAAEFSVSCDGVPGGKLEIVWTNATTSIQDFDRSGARFELAAIDSDSVTLRNSLGITVVFRGNQLIYDGGVESDQCALNIISAEGSSPQDALSITKLLERIEALEKRVAELEK